MARPATAAEVDALGLLCPLPVLRLARAVGRVQPGEVVLLRADDPQAREDVAAWCAGNGHEVVGLEQVADAAGRGELRAWVRKGG